MSDYIDPLYERNWRFLHLFLGIVWRIDMTGGRMSAKTALAVACIIHPCP